MGQNSLSQQTFQALARELKGPLVNIAREAELLNVDSISHQAISAMTLIDGFLLSAQADYGQLQLPIEPIGIGSVLYQVSHDAQQLAKKHHALIDTEVSQDNLIMANRRGLEVGIGCLLQAALQDTDDKLKRSRRQVRLISYKRRDGKIMAGVLSNNFSVTPKDLLRAQKLYGRSHLPVTTTLGGSGIKLAIASQMANSLGARLKTMKRNNMHGLGFELIKSEQLHLV